MRGDDIARRQLHFAVKALERAWKLPRDTIGRHVGRQLMPAATAGSTNYEEARSAESRADLAHEVSVAAKELSIAFWLELWVKARPAFLIRVLGFLLHILEGQPQPFSSYLRGP